jgi:hypothetical protein
MSSQTTDELKGQTKPKQKGAQRKDAEGNPRSKGLPNQSLLYVFSGIGYDMKVATDILIKLQSGEITIKVAQRMAKGAKNMSVSHKRVHIHVINDQFSK